MLYCPKKTTLCCLLFIDERTGIPANTLDSIEHPEEYAPPPLDTPECPPIPEEQGMQRAAAAVQTMTPLAFLARISAPIIQKTSSIINDVLSFMWYQRGTWLLESDGYRVGLKHKAADISRSRVAV